MRYIIFILFLFIRQQTGIAQLPSSLNVTLYYNKADADHFITTTYFVQALYEEKEQTYLIK